MPTKKDFPWGWVFAAAVIGWFGYSIWQEHSPAGQQKRLKECLRAADFAYKEIVADAITEGPDYWQLQGYSSLNEYKKAIQNFTTYQCYK